MRRKLGYIGLIMVCIAAVGAAFSYALGRASASPTRRGGQSEFQVVTSFYPIYIIVLNITEGVPGVKVHNLTANQTGCLHDYQLTTQDMRLLEQADVFFINGGGMETFLEQTAQSLPDLPILSSDKGIELLPGERSPYTDHANEEGDANEEEHKGHVHSGENAHIWMDPVRYQAQIRNLADGLIALDPDHQAIYEKNRDRYLEQVAEVAEEYQKAFLEREQEPVLLFHEAFAYLAESVPLRVVQVIELEGEERAFGAKELAELIEEVRWHQIRYLLVEETEALGITGQEGTIVEAIAKEGGAEAVALDPLTTGGEHTASWLEGMRRNLEVLSSVVNRKK